jgi:hypothetical protein
MEMSLPSQSHPKANRHVPPPGPVHVDASEVMIREARKARGN